MAGRGHCPPPPRQPNAANVDNLHNYPLYPLVTQTLNLFSIKQRGAILNAARNVTPEAYQAYLTTLLTFPYDALTTNTALLELFPEMENLPPNTLDTHRFYASEAARIILSHPMFALGILRSTPPAPGLPPTPSFPLYDPLSTAEFAPVRHDLANLRHRYPEILALPHQPPMNCWYDLEQLLDIIDARWADCGHSRLLYSILYLAFPSLRLYFKARSPVPTHLTDAGF